MFDILMYLFESYFHAGRYPDSRKMSAKLSAAGFEEDDIDQALDWLSGLEQLTQAGYPERINSNSPRCYAELEMQRISPEARQFVCFWELNKVITPIEREMIIDRAVAYGREALSLNTIKLITLMVLWNQHQELDFLLVEELLAASETRHLH